MLTATEEGKWVGYVYLNPTTEKEEQKHTWVVKHDGLIFGSGWYERQQNRTSCSSKVEQAGQRPCSKGFRRAPAT